MKRAWARIKAALDTAFSWLWLPMTVAWSAIFAGLGGWPWALLLAVLIWNAYRAGFGRGGTYRVKALSRDSAAEED